MREPSERLRGPEKHRRSVREPSRGPPGACAGRRFYQKVLDIYATSVDYAPDTEMAQKFFATVQNKMHWATHGQTAAEVVAKWADATKPFMGLQTTRPGGIVRKDDVCIAKNYLTEDELLVLNRIVSLYIEYAELQALERKPMTMRDWIESWMSF